MPVRGFGLRVQGVVGFVVVVLLVAGGHGSYLSLDAVLKLRACPGKVRLLTDSLEPTADPRTSRSCPGWAAQDLGFRMMRSQVRVTANRTVIEGVD